MAINTTLDGRIPISSCGVIQLGEFAFGRVYSAKDGPFLLPTSGPCPQHAFWELQSSAPVGLYGRKRISARMHFGFHYNQATPEYGDKTRQGQ